MGDLISRINDIRERTTIVSHTLETGKGEGVFSIPTVYGEGVWGVDSAGNQPTHNAAGN